MNNLSFGRRAVALAVTLVGAASFASPALATPNMFAPVTGAAFSVEINSGLTITHSVGWVINQSSSAQAGATASLGHATGGTNGFTVYGAGTGTFTCTVFVRTSTGNGSLPYSNSVTVNNAYFSMFIQTTPPAGDYFYSVLCVMPPKGGIYGVKPDH